MPEFEYTLIKIKSDSFYKNLKKDYTHSMGNSSTTGAELWQANSVRHNTHMMQNGLYKYNVYYEDAILILRTPVILTDGQIEFVVDNLVKAYGVEVTL